MILEDLPNPLDADLPESDTLPTCEQNDTGKCKHDLAPNCKNVNYQRLENNKQAFKNLHSEETVSNKPDLLNIWNRWPPPYSRVYNAPCGEMC